MVTTKEMAIEVFAWNTSPAFAKSNQTAFMVVKMLRIVIALPTSLFAHSTPQQVHNTMQ